MADVYSIAGNKLRPYTEIGMPYHGLATNGILPTSDGDKTIPQASFYGPCQVIRHPSAPGVNRNPNQIANDTAKGFDWRDYALLTGTGHGVNGSTELGSGKWLYCDPGGNTWVVGIGAVAPGQQEQVTHIGEAVSHLTFPVTNTGTLNNNELLIQVVLDEIWGRFGKPYDVTPRLLGEFIWTPDIPTWYGGAFTAEDVINNIDLTRPEAIVVNASGAEALLHIYMRENTQGNLISEQVYPETQPIVNGINGTFPVGAALVAIVSISLNGIGDKNDSGNGIAAVLADDSRFEDDLIISRTRGTAPGVGVEDWQVVRDPNPDCPDPFPPEQTTTYNPNTRIQNNGDTTGKNPGTTWEYEAVLYKTFEGNVRRKSLRLNQATWDISWTNTIADSYQLTNDPSNPAFGCTGPGSWNWYLASCSTSGYLVYERLETLTDQLKDEYVVFGQTYSYDLIKDEITYTETDFSDPGLPECPRAPFPGGNDYTDENVTLNGDALQNYAPCYHEFRVAAPNCHYVVIDQPQLTGTDRDMIEYVVVVSELGVDSEVVNKTTPHAPLVTPRKIPDLRELALTYQPVTGQFTSGPALLGAVNNNDIFQYV